MRLVTLNSGQFALPWYCDHLSAILNARQAAKVQRREAAAKLKRERAGIHDLLSIMELPETHMTPDEIERCDEFIKYKTEEIRRGWTPEQEAAARGVMQRKADRFFFADGRIFQQSIGIQVVGGDEWGVLNDESE